ncbi:hypothetical protein V5O48_019184 [Marasmius crinis-equi]|uniref:Uncharacterized protein n=1 Tax=Marasmius crinis-equi TaxID=585013 RepID=A0ABR3EJ34_9AGAR
MMSNQQANTGYPGPISGPSAGPSNGPGAYVFPSPATQASPAPNNPQPTTTTTAAATNSLPIQTQHNPAQHVAPSLLDVGNLAALPPSHSRDAPRKFSGSYTQVEEWIRQYEKLLYKHRITIDKERCDGILDYCSFKVKQTIRGLTSYQKGSWEQLKADILKLYDADRARQRFQPSDIQALALQQASQPIDNLSQWLHYNRRVQERGGDLVTSGKMTPQMYATYFWLGIPVNLRKVLELSLHAKEPLRDNTKPYEIDAVCAAAKQYFNRSNFASTIPDASIFGTLPQDEGSEDDDLDDEDAGESDFEEWEVLKKFLKKKKERKIRARRFPEPQLPTTSTKPTVSQEERYEHTVAQTIVRMFGYPLKIPL